MIRKTVTCALALLTLAPAMAAAQNSADESAVRHERAELLSEQAWLLANQKRDFEQAASYLREAAHLREVGVDKVRDLLNAGRFHFYADHLGSAVSALKDAGEVAMALGDVDTAEQAFLDGAFVAVAAGDLTSAFTLLDRAGTRGLQAVSLVPLAGDES